MGHFAVQLQRVAEDARQARPGIAARRHQRNVRAADQLVRPRRPRMRHRVDGDGGVVHEDLGLQHVDAAIRAAAVGRIGWILRRIEEAGGIPRVARAPLFDPPSGRDVEPRARRHLHVRLAERPARRPRRVVAPRPQFEVHLPPLVLGRDIAEDDRVGRAAAVRNRQDVVRIERRARIGRDEMRLRAGRAEEAKGGGVERRREKEKPYDHSGAPATRRPVRRPPAGWEPADQPAGSRRSDARAHHLPSDSLLNILSGLSFAWRRA